MSDPLTKIPALLEDISKSSHSSFYREVWSKIGDAQSIRLADLPMITSEILVNTSYNGRLYTHDTHHVVKVIAPRKGGHEQSFLVARTYTDLCQEYFGPLGSRPLVLFSKDAETFEKALWCYSHTVPLAGGKNNLAATAQLAAQYEVDTIISDCALLEQLARPLTDTYDLSKIENVILIDQMFPKGTLLNALTYFKKIHLVLALPEAGALAHATMPPLPPEELQFTVDQNTILEEEDGKLVVTRVLEMPTPIIRYKTDIIIAEHQKNPKTGFVTHFVLS